MAYLAAHEQPWPHNPTVEPGTILLLDSLAVNYLQHLGVLDKLKPAGFTAFVSDSEVEQADALIRHDAVAQEAKTLVEEVRSVLANGIASGKVRLGPLVKDSNSQTLPLALHPTSILFATTADAHAFVIDDRALNTHGALDAPSGTKLISTSLDVVTTLHGRSVISRSEVVEAVTTLRRAGFVLVPHTENELIDLVRAAPVLDGALSETAELRAIRESILRVRMTDVLQLPHEHAWLGGLHLALVHAIRAQWSESISEPESRARSTWLLSLIDMRGWSHRVPEGGDPLGAYRAQILALMTLPAAPKIVRDRYWDWVQDLILRPMREKDAETYAAIVQTTLDIIEEGVERHSGSRGADV